MSRTNIEWSKVDKSYKVRLQSVPDKLSPKGTVSYYVAERDGVEFLPFWGGNDAIQAQHHLDRLIRR
jgi:hypothetical protein